MSMVPARNHLRESSRTTSLACAVIVLAVLAVYYNSLSCPFIFDDSSAVVTNPSIHKFESALSPSPYKLVGGRPVLNFTFALNYALGGLDVRGYHALNLLVHALAGLTLFGLLRRTLLRPVRQAPRLARGLELVETAQGYGGQALTSRLAARRSEISDLRFEIGADATPLALAVAVIWTVHPLQTEAVTYISERAESLMGLFYLLTLYGFVRGASATGERPAASGEWSEDTTPVFNSQLSTLSSGLWFAGSVLACLLGVFSKEVVVTAPVMVLLYDRTFVAGSFCEAWRLRWRYYLGLAGTWLPLGWSMMSLDRRGIGFDQGVAWWSYALTSCRSLVLYLKLAIWPHPLVFDYGTAVVQHATEVAPYMLILAGLVAATAIALWRWPAAGFAGAWFFVILAPASSVIPVAGQPMAEHRMYLSLAAVVTLGVLGLYAWLGRRSLMVLVAAAMGLGWLTIQRNKDYRSNLAILSDTVEKCPD
ncbi:MAG TPA: hypothetical protein VGP21_00565, partial [Opitutaceae bacterium]|nr:hypothetical protein [Opitutaceae bacterium]